MVQIRMCLWICAAVGAAVAFPGQSRAGTWKESLMQGAAKASLLRIRSGGTSLHALKRERTLKAVKGAANIRQVLDLIEINEKESGVHCLCGGEVSFEFYDGDSQLAVVSLHHGRSLRWRGGAWSGDAMLTDRAATTLGKWLERQGIKGPLQEKIRGDHASVETASRVARYRKLMGDKLYLDWQANLLDTTELARVYAKAVPNEVSRAVLYFRIYGCIVDSWSISSGPQNQIMWLLPRLSRRSISAAAVKVLNDSEGLNGLARWIFWNRKAGSISSGTLKRVLPALVEAVLRHPVRGNRLFALSALGSINRPMAVKVLREVLAGKHDHPVLWDNSSREERGFLSEQVEAAKALAELRDHRSLPAIRALHRKSNGKAKVAFAATMKRMISDSETVLPQSLTRGAVRAGMGKIEVLVKRCYNQFRITSTVILKVTIQPAGYLSNVTATGRVAGTSAGDCLVEAVREAVFQPFMGQPITLSYPFNMHSP